MKRTGTVTRPPHGSPNKRIVRQRAIHIVLWLLVLGFFIQLMFQSWAVTILIVISNILHECGHIVLPRFIPEAKRKVLEKAGEVQKISRRTEVDLRYAYRKLWTAAGGPVVTIWMILIAVLVKITDLLPENVVATAIFLLSLFFMTSLLPLWNDGLGLCRSIYRVLILTYHTKRETVGLMFFGYALSFILVFQILRIILGVSGVSGFVMNAIVRWTVAFIQPIVTFVVW